MGVPTSNHPVYYVVVVLSVALFRLGYYWQARTSVRDRIFLTLAALGKAGFFAIFVVSWLAGIVPWTAPLLAVGDLLFAALFAGWLWKTRTS